MFDPFLESHRLSARFFSIGGKLVPTAIRDQMVRGQMFVERAIQAGYLQPDGPDPFLVVGAGAAGVAAACCAVERYGVRTLLIDRGDTPFATQANCPTRWIDPTLYDFPLDHCWRGSYPPLFAAYASPLAWQADWSHRLGLYWRDRFDDCLAKHRRLFEFRPNTLLSARPIVTSQGSAASCQLQTINPVLPNKMPRVSREQVSLALLAVGPGKEKTYLRGPGNPPPPAHPTRGFAFWQEDPFLARDLKLPRGVDAEVLISGSGDGALQDFLRLTLRCQSPAEVLTPLMLGGDELNRLLSAEQRQQRVFHWGRSTAHDHDELAALQQVHQEVVDDLLRTRGSFLRRELANLVRDPLPPVQLFYECTHFSNCYAINRFLVLLVARVLEEQFDRRDVLVSRRQLADIRSRDPTAHQCQGNAATCHGQWHEALWVDKPDCRTPVPDDAPRSPHPANVLVLRHGVDVADVLLDPTPARNRHLLPYYLLG